MSLGSKVEEPSMEELRKQWRREITQMTDQERRKEIAELTYNLAKSEKEHTRFKKFHEHRIAKKDDVISSLRSEGEELDTQLALFETGTKRRIRDGLPELKKQRRTAEEEQENVARERDKLQEVELQIAEVEKQLKEEREQHRGHAIRNEDRIVNKKKEHLKNDINRITIKTNEVLAQTAEMQTEISELRRERSWADSLYDRMSKEFLKGKSKMNDIVAQSTKAFYLRDEMKRKIKVHQERNEREEQQHRSDMRELQRVITHYDKVKAFVETKGSTRSDLRRVEDVKRHQGHDKMANIRATHKTEEREKRLKDGKDVSHLGGDASPRGIEASFKKIMDITGVDDLDEIVVTFIQNEDEIFTLCNYCNEKTSEVDTLKEEIKKIRADIASFHREDAQRDSNYQDLIKRTEKEYGSTREQNVTKATRLREMTSELDTEMAAVFALFQLLDCDPRPIQEMLGVNDINPDNVMVYLGQVEQKVIELSQLWAYISNHGLNYCDMRKTAPKQPQKKPPVPKSGSEAIIPPSIDDYQEDGVADDDDLSKPLTTAELGARVAKKLSAEGEAAAMRKRVTSGTERPRSRMK